MVLLLLLHSREAHASALFRIASMHPLNGTKSLLQALLIGHLLRRVRKTAGVSASVGPRSVGHRLPLAVQVDRIHPLVEKAEQAADRRTAGGVGCPLWSRQRARPGHGGNSAEYPRAYRDRVHARRPAHPLRTRRPS